MSEWTAGGTGFKWEKIGDYVAGEIVNAEIVDGTDLKGRPQRSRVLDVQPADGGEQVRVYVKRGQMQIALGHALKAAGRDMPTTGDKVAITFESEKPPTKPGFNPQKVYSVAYKVGETPAPGAVPPSAPATPPQSPSAADLI